MKFNAYTRYPAMLDEIYSRLFEQIQDKCHEAGIELLAPHYSAIRDGNLTTIPDEHVPDNYTSPGFQVHPVGEFISNRSQYGRHAIQPYNQL
jgi:hypothetical protein